MEQFYRMQIIYGKDAIEKLATKKVAIFGLGGVGGYVAEALARSAVGNFVLVDNDVVDITNINRQIIANLDTVGKSKVELFKDRISRINENANIEIHQTFFGADTLDEFDFASYDYVVDAIDTVSSKIELIVRAKEAGCKVISSMGMGNKIDPSKICIADIYKTEMDPLAKVMRYELKQRGVADLKVVYSKEEPLRPKEKIQIKNAKRIIGSTAFIPSIGGLYIASEVVNDLIREE